MSERIHFGKLKEAIEPPNLIELQINSYNEFFQKDIEPSRRRSVGLQAVFREFFPIFGFEEKSSLDFVSYELGEPKMSAIECQREGQTYSAPLYVTFRYKDEKSTKEEKVYMGEIPLMTPQGTFVINGAERVVVSQLHRSPGICFETSVHLNGKFCTGFGSSRIEVPGLKCNSTRAICSTSIWTGASAAANFWQRPFCGRWVIPPTKTSSSCSMR